MPDTFPDDAGLVCATLTGSRDAFAQIVARYQNLVCSVVYSGTGNLAQAQDLAQETFVIAWQELAGLRNPGCLRSWLCGIARKRVLKSYYQSKRDPCHLAEPLETAPSLPCPQPTPSDEVLHKEQEHLVWRSLERIPASYREALLLFYREDQSVEQVATSLGLSQAAAKQRLCRGRRLLRDEVNAVVEGVLKRTKPGDRFTALVLGALPSPASLRNGLLGLVRLKSAWTSWLPFLGVLGGGYIGWKAEIATARSGREHLFLVRKAGVLCLAGVMIFLGLHFGWWTILGNLANRFGHDVARIGLFYGLAILFLVQQGYSSMRQHRIRVEDGTWALPDPILSGPEWRVYAHVARRMAALLVAMALMAMQAISEQNWIAATFGFLLMLSFVWLGVRRWRSLHRDQPGAVFHGMTRTVVGFLCLTLLQYDLPRLVQGTLGWNMATLATNLCVTLLYAILFMAVLYATRARPRARP